MNQTASGTLSESLVVSQRMLDSLRMTKPWVRFLSVLGFIFVAFILLGALVVLLAGVQVPGYSGFSGLVSGLYLLMALLYFFPCLFLFRYAGAIGQTLNGGGRMALEQALHQQRSFWRYIGILTLIVVVLDVIVTVAVMVAAGIGAAAA